MAYEHKPNSGTAFKNKYKTTDAHPALKGDGKGVCPRCGEEWPVDLAIWSRLSQKGEKYVSISFKPQQAKDAREDSAAASTREPEEDDDIPF